MSALDGTRLRRRFLTLRALRWLPTGLLIPVLVLLLLDRGLSLGQIGLVTAAQGLMVLLLELPTGGLADALGRRRVLLVADVFELAAMGLLIVAESLPLFALVMALEGVYRALESGPLDAWYVDAAQDADPDADIESGLAAGGVVLGVAIGAGTLLRSGLVALDPIAAVNPLVVPLFAALVLRAVELLAIAGLMTEPDEHVHRSVSPWTAAGQAPTVLAGALRAVRASRILIALITVEFLWGFGMVAFETFTPVKLEMVLGSREGAAALLGPANAGAWIASAVGAGMVPALTRRLRPTASAAAMRIAQGLTVVGIALTAGPVGVLAAFVATMWIHGAANPVHQGLLHRAVLGQGHRTTVLSANSMAASGGGMAGGIALGVLADATSLENAILAGAAVLAAAAPLYLVRQRSDQPDRPTLPAGGVAESG